MRSERAHTLAELMIASVLVIALFGSAFGAFVLTKSVYYRSMLEYNLQRDANYIVYRMVKGARDGAGVFGLRSARSFTIPSTTEIDFAGTDGNTRRFFVNANAIVYESPTQSPRRKTIYTPPAGAAMTLRFWEPAGYSDHQAIGIYLSVSQQVRGKTVSGSLSTYVNVRNMER